MKEALSCRQARGAVQDLIDRVDLVSVDFGQSVSKLVPRKLQAHLEGCSECREFFQILGSYAPALRDQLDQVLRDSPAPALEAVLRSQWESMQQVPLDSGHTARAMVDTLKSALRRLFGPAGKPVSVLRWAAFSVAGVLLVSMIGLRIHTNFRTHRAIEQQIDSVVEMIYQEPLLSGVESALLRSQPTMSDYVEDLNRTVESWIGEPGSESYLN